MDFIAHIRSSDGEIQTVEEHLTEVQILAEKYGEKIGVKHLAGLAGMLHDLGKNTNSFKNYIRKAVENPDNPPPKGSVDHSTAGGKLLYQWFHEGKKDPFEKAAAEWVAMCILSHHSGLRDYLSPDLSSPFLTRVIEKEIPEFDEAVSTLLSKQISESEFEAYFTKAKIEVESMMNRSKSNKLQPISFSLIIKYIFSCLIDADRTNTRVFEENYQEENVFDSNAFFRSSYEELIKKIQGFENSEVASHPINMLRSEMSKQTDKFASNPSGIYTLSIPTGGGKTLASLRYALKHAIEYKKERIIYIVPYTTIIEQNAEEVRRILNNDKDILEHHSNVIEEKLPENEGETEDYAIKSKINQLSRDNWESPIIFTTMVQFLNVFYSKGTRNIRRLHNLVNSVLIFDEVQSVPIKCVSLFNEALNFLNSYCNSSIVLCTATQPALDFVENKLNISYDAEMIQDIHKVTESFKRVNIIDKTTTEGFNASQLKNFVSTEMKETNSVLVILNTKTAVRKLFEELSTCDYKDYTLFHLSTSMCPAHRKEILRKMKQALADKERVVCVSTQLIEAGVDISFECVVRSLAGLDSIAQAAGRCNRHGEKKVRNVYIIKSADEVITKLKEIRIGGEQTARILKDFEEYPDKLGNDLLSPEAMALYFNYYFDAIKGDLNYWIKEVEKNAFDLLNLNQDYYTAYVNKNHSRPPIISRQSFATAEKYFNVIENQTTALLVPYNDEAKMIISDLNGELDIKKLSDLLKKGQQYVINVYKHELDQLDNENNIDLLLHGDIFVLKEVAYTDEMGLNLQGDGLWSSEFI